jgi:hypothetical protein
MSSHPIPPPPPPLPPPVGNYAPTRIDPLPHPENNPADFASISDAIRERKSHKRPSLVSRFLETLARSKETPPWLISMIIHIAFLLILAGFPLVQVLREGISLTAHFDSGEEEVTVLDADFGLEEDAALEASNATPMEAVAPTELEVVAEVDMSTTMKLEEVAVERGLAGRSGSLKKALLGAFGGTGETEDAVQLGLAWLKKNQRNEGNWSLRGPYKGGAANEDVPAATSMALLAFLGAGNTHQSGDYADVVNKGIRYLVSRQREDGFLAEGSPSRQKMYSHAQATIAVCELYGLTRDPYLAEPAQKAVQFCVEAQSNRGGWRYEPREDQDVSVTGWYVMALMSARMAGIPVDSDVFFKISRFLDTVQRENGALYTYQDYDIHPSVSMTAEGLLCREYLGWEKDRKELHIGAEALLDHPISWSDSDRSVYYWYYATQVLHHIGGDKWRQWNDTMKVALPRAQEKNGTDAGSWNPKGDAYAAPGGRLYVTCLCIYCLEVYYRHMPLYGFERK